jgi:hypothetical protein
MLEQVVPQIISMIPPPILHGLAVSIPTVPSVWAFIEYVLPPNSSARKNHLCNLGLNAIVYMGLQASNLVTFGGHDWQGYLGAVIMSIMGMGFTLVFHKGVSKIIPALARPSKDV